MAIKPINGQHATQAGITTVRMSLQLPTPASLAAHGQRKIQPKKHVAMSEPAATERTFLKIISNSTLRHRFISASPTPSHISRFSWPHIMKMRLETLCVSTVMYVHKRRIWPTQYVGVPPWLSPVSNRSRPGRKDAEQR